MLLTAAGIGVGASRGEAKKTVPVTEKASSIVDSVKGSFKSEYVPSVYVAITRANTQCRKLVMKKSCRCQLSISHIVPIEYFHSIRDWITQAEKEDAKH